MLMLRRKRRSIVFLLCSQKSEHKYCYQNHHSYIFFIVYVKHLCLPFFVSFIIYSYIIPFLSGNCCDLITKKRISSLHYHRRNAVGKKGNVVKLTALLKLHLLSRAIAVDENVNTRSVGILEECRVKISLRLIII